MAQQHDSYASKKDKNEAAKQAAKRTQEDKRTDKPTANEKKVALQGIALARATLAGR